ncbi:MAG: Na/Pi symporter [Gammaproteobacteria bacterium]|nr:Na/Pi symporter [Gammaproteobacteria bacterium]
MLRKILLPTILLILGLGFWASPDFKTIAAGVAIFLFGMIALEEGFRAFTGGVLEQLLRRTTSSTSQSLVFGFISTTIMQSSSLVSVITISFLSAGLITLAAGIGIIFGANLGTTTGAWLVAGFGLKVNISAYAMPMLVFGVILLFQPSKQVKGFGYILSGLGFLFLGIHYMKEGFDAFSGAIDLSKFAVAGYPGMFLFSLIGIIATVVMQSSHATLVLIITALSVNQISYENALALAIGSNVGTTITAIIGAMSANEAGKRLASAHLIFNLVTGIIAIALIYQLIVFIDWFSVKVGIDKDDYSLKLAVFHTLFNLIGVLVMLPFIGKLVATLERIIPEKIPEVDQPRYLSGLSADYPGTAVEALRNETTRVYDAALRIIIDGLGFQKTDVISDVDLYQVATSQRRVHKLDIDVVYQRHIKGIYSAIVAFISTTSFSRQDEHSAKIHWLRDTNKKIVEAVKDTKHLQKNLVRYVGSDNKDMSVVYNYMRAEIAHIIRELEEMRESGEGVIDMSSLEALKLVVNEDQDKLNQTLSDLIGKQAITPTMGASLINDGSYASDIVMNLIQAAETLFVSRDFDLSQTVQDMLEDPHELDNIITKDPEPENNGLTLENTDGPEQSAK